MKCPSCGHEWRHLRAGLTHAEDRLMKYLRKAMNGTNISPTMREIGEALGMSKPNVHRIVGQLQRKGWIARSRYQHRSLRPVQE